MKLTTEELSSDDIVTRKHHCPFECPSAMQALCCADDRTRTDAELVSSARADPCSSSSWNPGISSHQDGWCILRSFTFDSVEKSSAFKIICFCQFVYSHRKLRAVWFEERKRMPNLRARGVVSTHTDTPRHGKHRGRESHQRTPLTTPDTGTGHGSLVLSLQITELRDLRLCLEIDMFRERPNCSIMQWPHAGLRTRLGKVNQ